MEEHSEKGATCTDDGNIQYWECTDIACGKLFKDEAGYSVISLEDTVIPATGIHYSTGNWVSDDKVHWHLCDECDEKIDISKHSEEIRDPEKPGYTGDTYCSVCDRKLADGEEIPSTHEHSYSEATCVSPKTCSCGHTIGEKDMTNHVGGTYLDGKKDPSDTEDGYTGDTYCKGCHTLLEKGEVIPKHEHEAIGGWFSDGNYHWHKCECGKIIDKDEHTESDWIIESEATEVKGGVRYKVCTVCGYETIRELTPATGTDIDEWYMMLAQLMNRKFTIVADKTTGGSITGEGKSTVKFSNSKTYYITPDEGYEIEAVYVNGKNVGPVSEYTFKNIRKDNKISVVFKKIVWENPFNDVADDAEYIDAIQYVYENGLFVGVSETEPLFAPDVTMTRAMFVTVLGRLAGVDTAYYNSSASVFDDVVEGEWYAPYVQWAAENGIILGYGDGTFGVKNEITVEQAAVIIARYSKYVSKYSESDYSLNNYIDGSKVSSWASEEMKWAIDNEVYCGVDAMLEPQKKAPRSMIAVMIYNYAMQFIEK